MDDIKKLIEYAERCCAPMKIGDKFKDHCFGCPRQGEYGCKNNLMLELIAKIKERL